MKKIAHITLILFIRMSHQGCVHNLNDFINNINNKDLKLKCRNMNDYAISVCSEKTHHFITFLIENKVDCSNDLVKCLLQRHLFIKTIEHINDVLMKHKAKFIFDLSSDMYKGLNDEIQKHNAFFLVKEYKHEVPHNDRQ